MAFRPGRTDFNGPPPAEEVLSHVAASRHTVLLKLAVDDLAHRWLNEGSLDASAAERLAELLTTLTSLYQEHIAVEDCEVFPAAELLSPSELEAIGREMASRRGLDFDRVVDPLIRVAPTR